VQYPSEFPHDARARVEAETRRAYIALEQDVGGMENWRRNVPFLRCVMRIFLAFAGEACEFGMKSHHPAWSDCELDQRCRDSLLEIVIDAWEHKAKDLGINKMFSSQGWGYSINDDDRRRIEKSPEWKQYQDLLIEAFDAQSAPAADDSLPQPEPAAPTAPETEAAVPPPATMASSGGRTPSFTAADTTQHERRRAVVDPILKAKRWTVNKWGTQAGVGKNCPYEYLSGRRNLSDANLLALAQVLGLKAEDLPN
jgi:hypothetical protein